jgi:CRISPR-associated protein Csm4
MYIVKLKFKTAVHFGNGNLSDGNYTISSDTLFSALFTECLNLGINTDFLFELRISDLFPYFGNEYFLPKPIMTIENKSNDPKFIELRKEYKNLRFIPLSKFKNYVMGETLPDDLRCDFGKSDLKIRLNKYENGDPYNVGDFTFAEKTGLYFLANTEKILPVLESLSFTGIGGKRSSGLGRFEFSIEKADAFKEILNSNSTKKMTISLTMAENLTDKILENSTYLLQKKSGFVWSEDYAETNRKKKDFYSFASGSVFENTFEGGIFDVSSYGKHKVYRYAKAMWVGV